MRQGLWLWFGSVFVKAASGLVIGRRDTRSPPQQSQSQPRADAGAIAGSAPAARTSPHFLRSRQPGGRRGHPPTQPQAWCRARSRRTASS
jgi:hypothetical protein